MEYEKIPVTKEMWPELKEQLTFYSSLHFIVDQDKISFELHRKKNSFNYSIGVFINGVMKGAETKENKEKYWRVKKCSMFSSASKKRILKGFSKKEIEKYAKEFDLDKKVEYFTPYFDTFSQLKSKYKSLNPVWLKPVY